MTAPPQNDAQALYNLGLMQAYGRGIDQNFRKAFMLFERVRGARLPQRALAKFDS